MTNAQVEPEEVTKLNQYFKDNGYTFLDVTKTMNMKMCMSYLHSIIDKPNRVLYFWRTQQTELLFSGVKDKKIFVNIVADDDPDKPNVQFLNKDNQMSTVFKTFDSIKMSLNKFLKDAKLECDVCYKQITVSGFPCDRCDFFICESCVVQLEQRNICPGCKQDNGIKQIN